MSSIDRHESALRQRPSVHELCVGSHLQSAFELGHGVIAVPLRPIGFGAETHYLAQYVVQIVGAPVEIDVVNDLIRKTADSRPVVALVLPMPIDAPADVLEESARAKLESARRVLSWISAREVEPVGVVVAGIDGTYMRPIAPGYRNRMQLFGLGGAKQDFQNAVLAISRRSEIDERFAFALSLYHDALKESNEQFRVARMFNVLESLSYKLKASLPSRKAVKALLGLPDGATVEMAFGETKIRFDAIEVAGRMRDKLFHGVSFSEQDLNTEARPILSLLTQYPGDFTIVFGGYCELELNRWALGTSKGQL